MELLVRNVPSKWQAIPHREDALCQRDKEPWGPLGSVIFDLVVLNC